MNRAKCNELDYIHFLIAAQKTFTCTEAARCQPEHPNAPAHDAFTRLLQRQPLDTEALWQEVQPCVQRQQGLLVIDDTTLDKPYAQKMDYVTYHWSGKHQRVVKGIALMTLLWTDGQALLPCDFRVYDKPFGGASKNAHFRAMLQQAWVRGFAPAYVVMDSWYASLENLKWIASVGWHFVTRLRSNRLVNPDGLGNRPISTVDIPLEGCVVHLKGFGWVKVFRTVSPHGDAEYLATNDLEMTQAVCLQVLRWSWGIEVYHRALKQCCGVERAQVRGRRAVWGHLLLALREIELSVISYYELRRGLVRIGAQRRIEQLEAFIRSCRLWRVDQEVARVASEIAGQLAARGERLDDADVLIGATARVIGTAVATGNIRHFSRIEGLVVENWLENV